MSDTIDAQNPSVEGYGSAAERIRSFADRTGCMAALHVELAWKRIALGELDSLRPGSVLEFQQKPENLLALYAMGIPVAKGKAVLVKDQIGLQIASATVRSVMRPDSFTPDTPPITDGPQTEVRLLLGTSALPLTEFLAFGIDDILLLHRRLPDPSLLVSGQMIVAEAETLVMDGRFAAHILQRPARPVSLNHAGLAKHVSTARLLPKGYNHDSR